MSITELDIEGLPFLVAREIGLKSAMMRTTDHLILGSLSNGFRTWRRLLHGGQIGWPPNSVVPCLVCPASVAKQAALTEL